MQTPEQLMRERLRTRAQQGGDPSEADERVLELQLTTAEPLTEEEAKVAYTVVPDRPFDIEILKKVFHTAEVTPR
jgi:predicted kinase